MVSPDFQLLHVDRKGKVLGGMGKVFTPQSGPTTDDLRALQRGMANVPGSRIERRAAAKPKAAAPVAIKLAAVPVVAPVAKPVSKPAAPVTPKALPRQANDNSAAPVLALARKAGLKGFTDDRPAAAPPSTPQYDVSTAEGAAALAKALGLKGFS